MEKFIFSAVRAARRFLHFKFLRNDFSCLRTTVGDAFTTMIYIWFLRLKELPVLLQKKAPVMGEEKVSLNIYISIARAMPFFSRSSLFCHIKSAEDTFHEKTPLFCRYCSDCEASRLRESI